MQEPLRVILGPRVDQTVERVEAELVSRGKSGPLYRLGNSTLVWATDRGTKPVTQETLRIYLARHIDFQERFGNGLRAVSPPHWLARAIMERACPALPELCGVVRMPIWQPGSGSLSIAGYDPYSRLLVRDAPMCGVDSSGSGKLNVDEVLDFWNEFPFATSHDRSVLLAMIVTILTRHAIPGPVPMFGISAPRAGTGKTFLATLVSRLTLGHKPPVLLPTDDESEMRKRILALALQAPRFVVFDNVEHPVRSPSLAAAVTGQAVIDRVLGKSEVVQAPVNSVWAITGNSLVIAGDLERRSLMLCLDATMRDPYMRSFKRSPATLRTAIRATRTKVLSALFGALQAYHNAGRPAHGKAKLGSFESWDSLVRGFVVWCGMKDPVRLDPGREHSDLARLLRAWHSALGEQPVTVDELLASPHQALIAQLPPAAQRGTKSLGHALGRLANAPCNGHVLRSAGRNSKGTLWQVVSRKSN